jgi:hypothetical protein
MQGLNHDEINKDRLLQGFGKGVITLFPTPLCKRILISHSSNSDLQNSVERTASLVLGPELSIADMLFTHTTKTDDMKRRMEHAWISFREHQESKFLSTLLPK